MSMSVMYFFFSHLAALLLALGRSLTLCLLLHGQQPGQLKSVPSNLDDVYVVLYESWTASLHKIKSIDMSTRNVTLTTTYNNKVCLNLCVCVHVGGRVRVCCG